jgi:AP-2 complex subunit alpha
MPVFPERESSILAVLKKKKPGRVPENEIREHKSPVPGATANHQEERSAAKVGSANASTDLLGLSTPPAAPAGSGNTGVLVDMLGELYNSGSPQPHSNNVAAQNAYNPAK